MSNLNALRAALLSSTPAERHALLVKSGKYDILRFFDHLPWLKDAADWTAWRTFLGATFGLELPAEVQEIFAKCTGLKELPKTQAREMWMICGRRARKSAIAATLGVFVAAYRDHSSYLAPGERATIPIIAATKKDAQQIRQYVVAILKSSPELEHLLEGEPTAEEVRLKTRCDFMIRAATITAVHARTIPLFIGDEVAFWRTDDSANPDREIFARVRPAQLLVPNPLIVGLSSPYAKRGILYDKYQKHFGVPGDVLVWQADTVTMHDTPEVRAEVEKAFIDDPISAAAEFGAKFRDDVAAFINEESLKTVIGEDEELLPERGKKYVAFVDPSGGSSDSFVVAISHFEPTEGVILDKIFEKEAPFDPADAVVEASEIIKAYDCKRVTGDYYAAKTFQSLFKRLGIHYHKAEKNRSDIYKSMLPLINGKLCRLLRNPKLKSQLLSLDRRVTSGGKELIDHPRDGHDDVANAVAGSLVVSDQLRWKAVEAKKEPFSTEEIFLDKIWSDVEKLRNPQPSIANPYHRRLR